MEDDSLIVSHSLEVKSSRFVIAVIAVTLSRFIYGYDRGAIGGASVGLVKLKVLTDAEYAKLISLPIFASVLGGLLTGVFQDKYGRKLSLLLGALMYGLGTALCICFHHPHFYLLVIGRLLCNFSFGMAHVTTLVYLIELTPQHLRGKVLVANQMVQPIGNSVAGLTNLLVSKLKDSFQWRLMLGTCCIPFLIQLICLANVPRSYKWLYSKGKIAQARQEAEKLYKSLTGSQFNRILDIDKSDESLSVNDSLEDVASTSGASAAKKIAPGTIRRMVIVALGVIVIGQVSGFAAVMFYSVQVAQTSGIGGTDQDSTGAFAISEGIFVANFIGVLISLFLIERLGRRKLLLSSQAGTLFSIILIVIAVAMVDRASMRANPWPDLVDPACAVDKCTQCVAQKSCGFCSFNSSSGVAGFCIDGSAGHSSFDRCEISGGSYCSSYCHSNSNWLLVAGIIIYVIYFSVGLAPLPFLIAAEIFPQHLRDRFTSISISLYYSLVALTTLIFGELYPIIGIKYMFGIFALLTLLGILFTGALVPETSTQSPEHMHLLFKEPWCCRGPGGYTRLEDADHLTTN